VPSKVQRCRQAVRGEIVPDVAACGILLLAAGLLFSGLLRGSEHLWGDFTSWYFPSHQYAAERMAHGALPLWNPYLDCGMPFAAEADHASFYPPSLLLHLFARSGYRLFRMLEFFTFLHIWFAGCAMYWAVRSLGCGRWPAVVAGLTYSLGGSFIARSAHVSHVCAQAYAPILLTCVWHAIKNHSWRPIIWSGIWLGLIGLAGSPATVVTLAVGLVCFMLAACVFEPAGFRAGQRYRWGLTVVGSVATIGMMLSAVQLLPMIEFVLASARTAYSYDDIARNALTAEGIVMQVVPKWFGWLLYHTPSYWGPKWFSEIAAYQGLLPLCLAVTAVRFHRFREVFPWLTLATIGFWLALGRAGGLHWLVHQGIPLLGIARAPSRYLLLWSIGVSVLAGFGLDAALRHVFSVREHKMLRQWLFTILTVGFGVALMVAVRASEKQSKLLAWQQPFFHQGVHDSLVSTGTAVAGLALLMQPVWPTSLVAGGVVASIATDLITQWHGVGMYPKDVMSYLTPPGYLRPILGDPSLFRVKFPHRPPSQLMLFGLQSESATARHLLSYQQFRSTIMSHYSPAFDLLNVRYLVAFENHWYEERSPNVIAVPVVEFLTGRKWALPLSPSIGCRGIDFVSTVLVDNSQEIPLGTAIGEIVLRETGGQQHIIPIRYGVETGDATGRISPRVGQRILAHHVWHDVANRNVFFSTHVDIDPMTVSEIVLRNVYERPILQIKELYLWRTTDQPDSWRRIHAERLNSSTIVHIYENTDMLPRAFLMARWQKVDSRLEALQRIHSRGFDPRQEVVIELPTTMSAHGAAVVSDEQPIGQVAIDRYESERIELSAEVGDSGAWLVLSEVFYPGWVATIDGASVQIVRANGLLRAVWLERGRHRVLFRYRPRSFYIGAAFTGLAILLLAIVAGWKAMRSRCR